VFWPWTSTSRVIAITRENDTGRHAHRLSIRFAHQPFFHRYLRKREEMPMADGDISIPSDIHAPE